jgi:S1-C subfamily serine protease
MTFGLSGVSQAVARVASGAAASVCAIRVGLNGHINGLVCEGGLIVTSGQTLPAVASHAVVLPGGTLAGARAGLRDAAGRLAVLHLETPCEVVNPPVAAACVGSLAVVVGADADAAVTARLTIVHRMLRNGDAVLDLSRDRVDTGSLVLDAEGRLVGLLALGPNGEAVVIPSSEVGAVLRGSMVDGEAAGPVAAAGMVVGGVVVPPSQRRAWLGVALQPIMVPEAVAARAGQDSGRMVVSMTKGGPAEMAGLRVGDVLLALNGTSASGPQALRAFLSPGRIGSSIDVRLLRDGNLLTAHLTVAVQPD